MNRKKWLQIIAQGDKHELKRLWQQANIYTETQWLREPEIGLLPLQARSGNTGDKFLFGDATITRAVVSTQGKTGYAFVLGRDKQHAECAALIDALMQDAHYCERIERQVLAPLATQTATKHAEQQAEVAATKVDFFTMVRGE